VGIAHPYSQVNIYTDSNHHDRINQATRASVQIGALEIDGFMLPDGSYRMSQTQAAEAVDLSRRNVSDFCAQTLLNSYWVRVIRIRFLEREEIEIEPDLATRAE
jgi:hypothetical protein